MNGKSSPLKTGAIGLSAGALGVAIAWLFNVIFHVTMPPEVSLVFGSMLMYAAHQVTDYVNLRVNSENPAQRLNTVKTLGPETPVMVQNKEPSEAKAAGV